MPFVYLNQLHIIQEQALRTICWNSLCEVIGVTVISISVCWYRLIVGVGER